MMKEKKSRLEYLFQFCRYLREFLQLYNCHKCMQNEEEFEKYRKKTP